MARSPRILGLLSGGSTLVLLALTAAAAWAQPTSVCPACPQPERTATSPAMWFALVLLALVVLPAIAALVALTVYLVRRSRRETPTRAQPPAPGSVPRSIAP